MYLFGKIADRVTVRISSRGLESFFNHCSREGIVLHNIRYDSYGVVCSVSASDFKKIRGCVRKSGVHINIVGKSGMGLYVRMRRKRYGFFLGAFAALVLWIYLTSCIWVIDVTGNEEVSSESIISCLEKHGLYVGSLRFGRNLKQLQNDVLLDMDSLAWLWVYTDGTRAVVEVREKGDSVEPVDKNAAYNIVASQNGYITDIIARSGQKVISIGDVVNEGDLLISGISSTAFHGNRYIHSDGYVMAKTWRDKSGEFSHTKTVSTKSGKITKKHSVEIMGHKFKLCINEKPEYKNYEKKTKTKRIKILGNIYLPVTFTTDTFCEIIKKDITISDAEVVSAAVDKLADEIFGERGENAQTVKKEYEYKKLKNGNLYVSVTVESIENIAKPVKIEVDKTEENISGEGT